MMAALKRIALCLLGRLVKDDGQKTAEVGVLEAERKAANEAPSSREETTEELERRGF